MHVLQFRNFALSVHFLQKTNLNKQQCNVYRNKWKNITVKYCVNTKKTTYVCMYVFIEGSDSNFTK